VSPKHDGITLARQCPVCGSDKCRPEEPYNSYDMRRCLVCGLVFCAQRHFPQSLYNDVYAHDPNYVHRLAIARGIAHGGNTVLPKLNWLQRASLRWLRRVTVPRRLLDVGCSSGIFLWHAQRVGWSVCGVEPAEAAVEAARALGIAVHCGYMNDLAERSSEFTLKIARRLLVPGGILILSVPNADDPY